MKFLSKKKTAEVPKKKAPPVTKLSKTKLEHLLAATYDKKKINVDNYVIDTDLSDDRVKVYQDPATKHTVVAHRGSATGTDWFENALYGLGIKAGSNWSHSKKVQKAAEKKYGTENLTTIGHSKGALHAQEFGKRGREILTLNKPVNVSDILYKVPKKQTDYQGEGDIVSVLRPLQRGNKQIVLKKDIGVIKRVGRAIKNPIKAILAEHSTRILERQPSGTQTITDVMDQPGVVTF